MLISENIKKIRQFRGFEPAQVITGARVPKTSYYEWEAGKYGPDSENLEKLSGFFRVPKYVFSVDDLTKEYLEKNFSDENPTGVNKANGNTRNEKVPEEVYRDLVEANSDYRLIPKTILDEYDILPKKEIENRNKMMDLVTKAMNESKDSLIEKYELIIQGLENKVNRLENEKEQLLRQIPAKKQ